MSLVLEVMLRPSSSLEKGDWEGSEAGKLASRGQGQRVHLCGNHRAWERGVCQDGLESSTAPTGSARAAELRECRRWWEERLVGSSEGWAGQVRHVLVPTSLLLPVWEDVLRTSSSPGTQSIHFQHSVGLAGISVLSVSRNM